MTIPAPITPFASFWRKVMLTGHTQGVVANEMQLIHNAGIDAGIELVVQAASRLRKLLEGLLRKRRALTRGPTGRQLLWWLIRQLLLRLLLLLWRRVCESQKLAELRVICYGAWLGIPGPCRSIGGLRSRIRSADRFGRIDDHWSVSSSMRIEDVRIED